MIEDKNQQILNTFILFVFIFKIVYKDDESSKQRLKVIKKLNKVNFSATSNHVASSPPKNFSLNAGVGSAEEKVYVREHFVAPEISMINYFLKKTEVREKVNLPNEKNDSDDENELKDQVRGDDDYDEESELELKLEIFQALRHFLLFYFIFFSLKYKEKTNAIWNT